MNNSVKIKVELDGWKNLSKKQQKEILDKARTLFLNVNFFENTGLIIETNNILKVFIFVDEIIERYKSVFKNWDGFLIRKVSKSVLNNYIDKKKNLKLEYFKDAIKNNNIETASILIAGPLYLEPDYIQDILFIVREGKEFKKMSECELEKCYKQLLNYTSYNLRKFSLIK